MHINYSIEPFFRFLMPTPPLVGVRMFDPLKGEPHTVLVMPKFIVAERMFDVKILPPLEVEHVFAIKRFFTI